MMVREWTERVPQTYRLEKLQQELILRQKRQSFQVRLWQWGLLFAGFLFWEGASRQGWLDPLLFSSPSAVFRLLEELAREGTLWTHIGVTVYETVVGFALGVLGGALVAFLLWLFPFLLRILDPYLVVLNSLPKIALGPVFIVAFGAGTRAIMVIAAFVSIFVTIQVLISAFRDVDENYVRLARSFGATKGMIFRKIIFPACLPMLLATLKVNIGLAWIGVIVGEFLVGKKGLGALIVYGFQIFNFTYVYAGILLVALLASSMYVAFQALEDRYGG
ncbi:MAG: ABC transporter permease [Clostridiales bacterium]|nr:ABC transporter permease [Clostridiales bacterium]